MKDIITCLFVAIGVAIPIIFIYKDITDLHNFISDIIKNDMQVFVDFDKRLKKLENKKKKNKEEK